MLEDMPMTSRWIGSVLAACVLAAITRPAEAQIGGFLKKKAKEAAQAPVQQQQANQQSDEAAARALEAPDVVPITQESTARFGRALDVEIRLRGEFKTQLGSMKSKEEYEACKSEVAMTQDPMQMAAALASLGDKATPAEIQKVMVKMSTDMEAQLAKRCGADPSGWPDYKRAERLREIEAVASDAFAPASGAGEAPAVERPGGPSWVPTDDAQTAAHPYARKYAIAKERWIPFCAAEAEKTSSKKFVRIKLYAYTVEEAQVLSEHCPDVMAKLNKVTEPVRSAK